MTEPLSMIEALSLRYGNADCTVKNTAVRLVLMTFWNTWIFGRAQRRAARDAGIGEQDVILAEFFGSLADRCFGRGDVCRVSHHRQRVRAQFIGGGIERRLISSCDDDLGALGYEHSCGRQTDAAVAACDQCRLVREPHGCLQWLHY